MALIKWKKTLRLSASLAVAAAGTLSLVVLGAQPGGATGGDPSQTVLTASVTTSISGQQSATLTATVTPANPGDTGKISGTVLFTILRSDNLVRKNSCINGNQYTTTRPIVNGAAICNTRLFGAGSPFTVTATYEGNSTFASSTSNSITETVQPGPSSTFVTANPPSPNNGGHVTIQAFVRGDPYIIAAKRTGTVQFSVTGMDGTPVPCTAGDNVNIKANGKAFCKVASHLLQASDSPYTVTANYSGDPDFQPSSGTLTLSVGP